MSEFLKRIARSSGFVFGTHALAHSKRRMTARLKETAMGIFARFSTPWVLPSRHGPPKQVPLKPSSDALPRNETARALEDAERKGFRFAVVGRSCTIMAIGLLYLANLHFPSNAYAICAAFSIALIGMVSLAGVRTRYERAIRFGLFAFDTVVITALLAVVPLTTGGEVPQNLVFLTTKVQYYYVLIATAILTLSPGLVIWTGVWAVGGLAVATGWIVLGMDNIVTFGNLMPAPSREAFLDTFLNPDFIALSLRVHEAITLAAVTAIAAWGVQRARNVVRAHAQADAERQRVENLFGRYVPPSVLTELIREGYLEPQMREATLLFIDIEGFTRITETMPPAKLVLLLNALFSAITGVIDKNGGVVVNYIGDAVIASFNAPLPATRPAIQALEAARRILELVAHRQFEGLSIHLRIGIATGPVAAGTVGSDRRQTYTLYGDAVNLAQRLEALSKDYGTQCLVCGTTANLAASSHNSLRSVGLVSIRNREHPVEAFQLQ